jgi:hypothetical protein
MAGLVPAIFVFEDAAIVSKAMPHSEGRPAAARRPDWEGDRLAKW